MSARELARRVLARVDQGAYATLALSAELGKARLADNDAALATELVYGVLKRRLRLDRALGACATRGLDKVDAATTNALRIAAYQILSLRVPAHAAVDDAVGAIKRTRGERMAGFANAVLRRLAQSGEAPLPDGGPDGGDAVARLSIEESTPAWIVRDAIARLGEEEARALLSAWNAPAPTWLRTNPKRASIESVAESIARDRPRATVARPRPPLDAVAPLALSLARAGDPSSLGAFARGEATAQDLGAQLVTALVEPRAGEAILDACAGVGGKSFALATLADDALSIDAADVSERKLQLAADGAHRLGLTSIRTVVADLTDPGPRLADGYDRVLLDAPCSGLGVLRRHPELKWRRTREEIVELAALQARLLDALVPRVRPGGLLVYAVCTFTDEEGPRQIDALLARHPQLAIEPPPAALAPLAHPSERGAIRTWPHTHDADAFYAVRLRRR